MPRLPVPPNARASRRVGSACCTPAAPHQRYGTPFWVSLSPSLSPSNAGVVSPSSPNRHPVMPHNASTGLEAEQRLEAPANDTTPTPIDQKTAAPGPHQRSARPAISSRPRLTRTPPPPSPARIPLRGRCVQPHPPRPQPRRRGLRGVSDPKREPEQPGCFAVVRGGGGGGRWGLVGVGCGGVGHGAASCGVGVGCTARPLLPQSQRDTKPKPAKPRRVFEHCAACQPHPPPPNPSRRGGGGQEARESDRAQRTGVSLRLLPNVLLPK